MITRLEDLADLTLIDENTKFILIDDANKEIPSLALVRNLATRWRLQLWSQPMGPLCLWQCLLSLLEFLIMKQSESAGVVMLISFGLFQIYMGVLPIYHE